MESSKHNYCFLAIGKTTESTETSASFKRYVGVAGSFVKAVNPDKKTLDEIMGFENQSEPEYVVDTDNGKEARITFIVVTDPETNNGIEIKNRLTFTLRPTPAYNKDQTKVQVVDDYGNHTWANVEDAKAGKALLLSNGNPMKIDTKYRMACAGECDLLDFLKAYLCVADAFNYTNGVWVKKDNASECLFKLEHVKDYFKGDFSELKEALAIQPNNKVKLLYGVRTTDEGKLYQTVASKGELILRNSANASALTKLEKDLANAKQNGAYATTEFKVQELQEYVVTPTNLVDTSAGNVAAAPSDSEMPWD